MSPEPRLSFVFVALNLMSLFISTTARAETSDWQRISWALLDVADEYPEALDEQKLEGVAHAEVTLSWAIELAHDLGPEAEPVRGPLESLRLRVHDKMDAKRVARDAKSLEATLARLHDLRRVPPRLPDLARGAKIYAESCAACHGADGRANTPVAGALNPKPTHFRDAEAMQGLSPYRVYLTARFGEPGTQMPSFEILPEDALWDVAFYALSLAEADCPGRPPALTPESLALSTGADLRSELGEGGAACVRKLPTVASSRARRVVTSIGLFAFALAVWRWRRATPPIGR